MKLQKRFNLSLLIPFLSQKQTLAPARTIHKAKQKNSMENFENSIQAPKIYYIKNIKLI